MCASTPAPSRMRKEAKAVMAQACNGGAGYTLTAKAHVVGPERWRSIPGYLEIDRKVGRREWRLRDVHIRGLTLG